MDCKEILLDHNIILSLNRLSCSLLRKVLYKHVLASVNGKIRPANQRITYLRVYDLALGCPLENMAFMEKSFEGGVEFLTTRNYYSCKNRYCYFASLPRSRNFCEKCASLTPHDGKATS